MKRTWLGTLLFSVSSLSTFINAATRKPAPPLPQEWEEILPGGETLCAHGTPFSFFVAKGKSEKVVIDFIGGGACWDATTCDHTTKTYMDSLDEFKRNFESNGIYARTNANNPLKDWTHVIVPYCTGDLHWGSNDQVYTKKDGSTFTIHHRGAVNTKAVLKWVQEHHQSPEKIFVTGFSAGAYASAYWLPRIKDTYPASTVTQFGDSGISPITEEFAKVAFAEWNATKEGPTWVPGLDPNLIDWSKLQIGYIYDKMMKHYPDVRFAHYTTAFDGTQRAFFWLMHGDTSLWPVEVQNTLHTLGETPQFRYFTSPGSEHGILSYSRYYEVKSTSGISFQDWFKQYVEGQAIDNYDCVGCVDEDLEQWFDVRPYPEHEHDKSQEIRDSL